jgi:hypothetical protein
MRVRLGCLLAALLDGCSVNRLASSQAMRIADRATCRMRIWPACQLDVQIAVSPRGLLLGQQVI